MREYQKANNDGFDLARFILATEMGSPLFERRHDLDQFVDMALLPQLRRATGIGFAESLLVSGAREVITQWFQRQSSNFEEPNKNRAAIRMKLESVLDDPLELEKMREDAQRDKPDEIVTIEQVQRDVRRMLDGPWLRELDADNATAWWAMEKAWNEIAGAYLNNADIEEWRRLRRPTTP